MVATVRKAGAAQFNMNSAAVADILDVLARHNPGISSSVISGFVDDFPIMCSTVSLRLAFGRPSLAYSVRLAAWAAAFLVPS